MIGTQPTGTIAVALTSYRNLMRAQGHLRVLSKPIDRG